jgi:regulator of ribonuclease activity A
MISTADLCDAHGELVQVVASGLTSYGGKHHFAGSIATIRVFEDNVILRTLLEQAGHGRVLVVDGGASVRCALLGDQIASLAQQNGWVGVVLNAAIRDVVTLQTIEIGIKALTTCPKRSAKLGGGEHEIPVTFGGVTFTPGDWLVSDADGIVVVSASLGLEISGD